MTVDLWLGVSVRHPLPCLSVPIARDYLEGMAKHGFTVRWTLNESNHFRWVMDPPPPSTPLLGPAPPAGGILDSCLWLLSCCGLFSCCCPPLFEPGPPPP
ncbi:hypothetical protein L6164_019080 [Bauhinia variegata]|uniref:Uncharacterized protein n=1 Tax=Bauhinia variegata TaxID=167791 RepID=A0ACB9NE17_BAUVA|nr:hypothetical protein L6164_019080 [Bauhinia variegata]